MAGHDEDSRRREVGRIGRSALVVSLATFASRVLGLVRDSIIYRYFPVMATDAFFLAFMIPNTLRRLVAEGALTISFVPLFSEALAGGGAEQGRREAREFASVAFTFMLGFLSVLTGAGILAAPLIVEWLVPGRGFASVPGKIELTVRLTRLVFPYIFFISLVALAMGILNARRRFFAPALSPLLLNVAMIAASVLLRPFFDPPILALAWGVLGGGVLQLLFQIPALRAEGFLPRLQLNLRHPRLRKLLWLMFPAAFGVAVYQAFIFVARYYASYLPEGVISYQFAADRLIEFPLALVAVAFGTAMLPSLSDYAARKDVAALNRTYSDIFTLMLFLILPATAGLFALRVPILNVLFQRGPEVDAAYIAEIARVIEFLAFGMWAVGGVRLTAPLFYALKDTRTPVLTAAASLALNITLSHLFILEMHKDQGWLALAATLTSAFNLLLLWTLIRRRLPGFSLMPAARDIAKIIVLSALMGVLASAMSGWWDWTTPAEVGRPLVLKAGQLGAILAVCVVAYFAGARLMNCGPFTLFGEAVRRRLKR